MKISSYKTALEPGFDSALDIPHAQELYLATFLHTLASELTNAISSISIEADSDLILDDIFHFGMLWEYIAKTHPDLTYICQEILERRKELVEQKADLKQYIDLYTDKSFAGSACDILKTGRLIRSEDGAGSAYFLYDEAGVARFVVKPVDEDIFCLNNRKNFGSPLNEPDIRVRDDIPLYRSAQTDVLAYLVAKHLKMESITPKTVMMIIDSPSFYDISENISLQDNLNLPVISYLASKEKVCSVQEHVEGGVMMQNMVYEWLEAGKTEEEISSMLCNDDFEMANLFIWTCFDNDAHLGNFVLYPKEDGLYGIKKVDNGLSFPEENSQMKNFLTFFTKAKTLLSPAMKEKIHSIPKQEILQSMQELSMSPSCQNAFVERCQVIQALAEREGMTIYEMNLRLLLLGREEGHDLALKEMNIEDIEIYLGIKTT